MVNAGLISLALLALPATSVASFDWVLDTPSRKNYTRMTADINVIEGAVEGYYYASSFFLHQNGHGVQGYIGLQPRKKQPNHLTFSYFGPSTSNHPNCYPGADLSSIGTSCAINWPWEFNHTYTTEAVLKYHNETDGSNTWVGNLLDGETKEVLVEIGNWTTAATEGIMSGEVIQFDEPYWAMTPCLYSAKYIQHFPVFYTDDGESEVAQFQYYLEDYTKAREDECAVYWNKLNIEFELDKQNNVATIINGFLPLVPSSTSSSSTSTSSTKATSTVATSSLSSTSLLSSTIKSSTLTTKTTSSTVAPTPSTTTATAPTSTDSCAFTNPILRFIFCW